MKADDFSRFFEAVYGVEPFPWQSRLAREVIGGQGWPPVLSLPTSTGKTAVIDIAVFALACEGAAHTNRQSPRRIFFVVDRRIVVDEAYDRARHLARKLDESRKRGSGLLHRVADGLLARGGEVPLQVARLRGGMYLDQSWTRSPAQPLVCVSTVDQVGSRLLFRGYGLDAKTCNTLPIHAGLIGNDALVILDESHLSTAFSDTLDAVARYRIWAEEAIVGMPWTVVRMSATPGTNTGQHFREESDDHGHAELGKRLGAEKIAKLVEIPCEASRKSDSVERKRELELTNRTKLVKEACSQALSVRVEDPEARVVGIVVNRVATARDIFEALRAQVEEDVTLLVGPSRPYDRERILEELLPRMRAGRKRCAEDRPLFVVATQCIEVGADLDFDGLVTECAPLDALRQRFGRLDRLGRRRKTRAVILARSDQTRAGSEDPVYGGALASTWVWLVAQAGRKRTIHMGVAALAKRIPGGAPLDELLSPRREAPVTLPAHLDLWVQTSPIPVPDPDIALFLHGPDPSPADVQVVWRADLVLDHPDTWVDIVGLVQPSSLEALSVPLYAVREWLRRAEPSDVADVEGSSARDLEREPALGRRALRWLGPEASQVVRAAEIRPGDTLVVPSAYGGADRFGWTPEADEPPVLDVGDSAFLARRSRPVLRIHATLISSWLGDHDPELQTVLSSLVGAVGETVTTEDREVDAEERLLEVLAGHEAVVAWARRAASVLLSDARRHRVPYPDGSGVVLVSTRRKPPELPGLENMGDEFTDEDDASSLTRAVALREHSDGVAAWVARFARETGLPEAVADDLRLAASLHDVGKTDPRFQAMLHGGDEVAATAAREPLAKSSLDPRNRTAWGLARLRAGYPAGYRHESMSLALVESSLATLRALHDPDLVLHLVASHHGCARPFLPVAPDPNPVEVRTTQDGTELMARSNHGLERLDSGVSDRFWRLVRRYGWYGLAFLEAIFRLADHRRSEEEQLFS